MDKVILQLTPKQSATLSGAIIKVLMDANYDEATREIFVEILSMNEAELSKAS